MARINLIIIFRIILIGIFISFLFSLINKYRKRSLIRKRIQNNFMNLKEIRKLDGFEFEEYCYEQFRGLGFTVMRTPKTGDFGVDLIVEDFAIQIKNYTDRVGISAIQEIYAGAAYYEKIPVVLITHYYTKSAIQLAQALEIELIDLDDILNWINKSYKREYSHKIGFYEMIKYSLNLEIIKEDKGKLEGRKKNNYL